ncbi:MAG: adhesin [Planctomycetota bacterium]|nr:MAG: adhesin [Planctomycetota bacterium]
MPLPTPDRAVIDPAKVRDYLLSTTHPVGRFKAAFFQSLGYEADQWQQFAADLRAQHLGADAEPVPGSRYGQKYLIRASLKGPSGKRVQVVSIWLVLVGEDFPRLITAYPGDS